MTLQNIYDYVSSGFGVRGKGRGGCAIGVGLTGESRPKAV